MRASDGRSESSKSATRRQTLHLQYSQVFVQDLFARKTTSHAPRDLSRRDETTLVGE